MGLTEQQVKEQSNNAYAQWAEMWRKNAKANGEAYKATGRTYKDLLYSCAGKTLLCCATGPSFEDNMPIIKKYRDNIKIACVDKCFASFIENGIKPDFVFLADAGIDHIKWLLPYVDDTKDVTLVQNVTANPEWHKLWQGPVYYYVNKDNIDSEKEFGKISGCQEIIPASSNVGNSVVVFSAQAFAPDGIALVGYDFCWGPEDNYYAFQDSEKRYWMTHMQTMDFTGRLVRVSGNLEFSSKWLSDFYNNYLLPQGKRLINCSGKGILFGVQNSKLEKVLKKSETRVLNDDEKAIIINARKDQVVITAEQGVANPNILAETIAELNVTDVTVNHVPQELVEWLS